jgi:hypothetical protein
MEAYIPTSRNLIGQRFDRLLVLSKQRNEHNNVVWECICDCGNKTLSRTHNLTGGYATSCGCKRKEGIIHNNQIRGKIPGEAAKNQLYSSYKIRSLKKNIIFDIDKETFYKLTESDCYYCGAEPSQKIYKRKRGYYLYNGIDRVDNTLGYSKENCVSCCKICNYMKQDLTLEEFYSHIRRIHERIT